MATVLIIWAFMVMMMSGSAGIPLYVNGLPALMRMRILTKVFICMPHLCLMRFGRISGGAMEFDNTDRLAGLLALFRSSEVLLMLFSSAEDEQALQDGLTSGRSYLPVN